MSAEPEPVIILLSKGAFFRMEIRPPSHLLDIDRAGPRTFTSHIIASDAAKTLSKLTGLPVIDMTAKGGGNVPVR